MVSVTEFLLPGPLRRLNELAQLVTLEFIVCSREVLSAGEEGQVGCFHEPIPVVFFWGTV